MKRRLLWIGVLVMLAIGGVASLRFWFEGPSGPSGPTRENVQRLFVGMPKPRVLAIMGDANVVQKKRGRYTHYTWTLPDYAVELVVDHDDKLVDGHLMPSDARDWYDYESIADEPRPMDVVRRWLRL